MASTRSTTSHGPPLVIRRKLSSLRWSLRGWVVLQGLSRLGVAVAAASVASLLVDRWLRLDQVTRAVVLVAGIVGACVLLWRRCLTPLRARLDDDQLCLRVEASHPQLGQRLITAVQLSRVSDPAAAGLSPVMVRASIDHGVAAAQGVDFRHAVRADYRRRTRRLAVLAGALSLAMAGAFVSPATADVMGLWFRRNVLLSAEAWPRRTQLALVDVPGTLPRGDDFEVVVRAGGQVPLTVSIDFADAAGTRQVVEAGQVAGDRFRASVRNVLEPFRFRVRGGDDQLPWMDVRLVDRPRVEQLGLRYEPPAYTGLPPVELAAAEGVYELLRGASLELRVTASKAVRSLRLTAPQGEPVELTPSATNGPGASAPREFTGRVAAGELRAGVYVIEMTDVDGLASREPTRFSVRLVPDRRPTVRAKLLGISSMVTPDARVPIQVRANDDFGIVAARLVTTIGTTPGATPGTAPGATPGTAPATRPGDAPSPAADSGEAPKSAAPTAPGPGEAGDASAVSMVEGQTPVGTTAEGLGTKELACIHRMELAAMSLTPGQNLAFRMEAVDNDAVSGAKTGQSSDFFLRVVTEAELRQDLQRRQQEQRYELERLKRDQEQLQTDCRAMLATGREGGKLSEADRQTLTRVEKRQRLVTQRLDAIAGRLAQLRDEYVNNALEDEQGQAIRDMNTQVVGRLRDLVTGTAPKAAEAVGRARREAGAGVADRSLDDAVMIQEELLTGMNAVLAFMQKWEGYQEAVALLNEVLKAQKDVREQTRQRQNQLGEDIFGPGR